METRLVMVLVIGASIPCIAGLYVEQGSILICDLGHKRCDFVLRTSYGCGSLPQSGIAQNLPHWARFSSSDLALRARPARGLFIGQKGPLINSKAANDLEAALGH
jgi:hypothetical protein